MTNHAARPLGLRVSLTWCSKMSTDHITFRTDPPGTFGNWHTAPRRQFVRILSGQYEIGFSDGTTKLFGDGDARLVENTTGKGQTTRVYGDEPILIATVSLS